MIPLPLNFDDVVMLRHSGSVCLSTDLTLIYLESSPAQAGQSSLPASVQLLTDLLRNDDHYTAIPFDTCQSW